MEKHPSQIKKHGGRMMMLIKVLWRSTNYGKVGNTKTQVRGSIQKQKEREIYYIKEQTTFTSQM